MALTSSFTQLSAHWCMKDVETFPAHENNYIIIKYRKECLTSGYGFLKISKCRVRNNKLVK